MKFLGATVALLLNVSTVAASTNHNHQYSLNQHISFDPKNEVLSVAAETEAMAFFDDYSDSSFCSSMISMECGIYQHNSNNKSSIQQRLMDMDLDLSDSDLEDSDSEDDDDDDGHSAMLSNVSLRKSLALASSSGNVEYVSSNSKHGNSAKSNKSSKLSPAAFSRGVSAGSTKAMSALSVRGGASAAPSNEFAKRLVVAALVTLMYEGALGHLLEFVKIVMQTSPAGTTYMDVLRSITSEKGLVGIWDGFIPWGVVQSIGKGGVFGLARAMALSVLMPLVDEGKLPNLFALTLAGGIAGGFQGYVLSPTLLLKTRVMTNPIFREQMSMLRTTILSLSIGMDVVTKEGVGALMKGSNVFALKRVFDWSTRFYFSDIFLKLIKTYSSSDNLSASQKISADLLGGTASTLVTLPLDVLVAKSQDAKKAGVKVSAMAMFKEELQEKGVKGLYDSYMRGFEARLLHVCFTTVAMKTGTGLMYDFLFKK